MIYMDISYCYEWQWDITIYHQQCDLGKLFHTSNEGYQSVVLTHAYWIFGKTTGQVDKKDCRAVIYPFGNLTWQWTLSISTIPPQFSYWEYFRLALLYSQRLKITL